MSQSVISQRKKPSDDEKQGIIEMREQDHELLLPPTNSHHLSGDFFNIGLLVFLYVLQGIPLGLAGSIPLILQNRKVSYAQQAAFSFVNWPFSVKLLWAPIVDSIFSNRFGRRKSWLVPTQYLIGVFLFVSSSTVDSLLGDANVVVAAASNSTASGAAEPTGVAPNVFMLTLLFLVLNFLCATQDIAVDGWALTILSRKNVGYASTCNTVGQTAGFFLGNVVFLALESADFCNRYFRITPQAEGFITLSGFLYFWAIVFLVTTTLVMIFIKEKASDHDDADMGVAETYSMLYRILKLKSVQTFVVVLLTCKIGFGITDSATGLKLIEAGVHKENLALLAIPLVPMQIILPLVISKYTAGARPLDVFLKAYPYRLMFGLLFPLILQWTNWVKNPIDATFPLYYYVVIVVVYCCHQVALYSMFVALMGFHARVSDPAIGGTYMTLLNTVTNLGGNWPQTLTLYLVDSFTLKSCSVNGLKCDTAQKKECSESGGTCETTIDGYYILSIICISLGLIWLRWGRAKVQRLQLLPPTAWKCT